MTTPLTAAPSPFQRSQARLDFERVRQALIARFEADPAEAAQGYSDVTGQLDAGVTSLKQELVGSPLCWNDEHWATGAWIHEQHRELFEAGRGLADHLARTLGAGDSRALRVIALALFHWGESVKWAVDGRARRDCSPVHGLMRLAVEARRHVMPGTLRVEGRVRTVSLENLYFRALLLDRFSGGGLTRQQLEVLDAWLWEWSAELDGYATHPGGPALRADLDSAIGLQHGARDAIGHSIYLSLAPLETRRRMIVHEFHQGRIVPKLGCASRFRIEEHVAVLDHLRKAFSASDDGCRRALRERAPGTPVEVWFGLGEITERGLGTLPSKPEEVCGQRLDIHNRRWSLVNASETGLGFEALEEDAEGISVGDLVGLRVEPSRPCVLARVARRLDGRDGSPTYLGVERLTDRAEAVTIARADLPDDRAADETFIFVPGRDACGRRDAFIVPDRILPDRHTRDVVVEGTRYSLRFNRVRARGRGWALAGFEIESTPAMTLGEEEAFANMPTHVLPLLDDDAFDRTPGRERSSRLN